jgi:hypothetical protein
MFRHWKILVAAMKVLPAVPDGRRRRPGLAGVRAALHKKIPFPS